MNIIGHERIRKQLAALAARVDRPQSYLITGPDGVGKGLVAREFAQRLLGLPVLSHAEGEPVLLDLMVLDREERTESRKKRLLPVSVEQIRTGLTFLSRSPSVAQTRVLLIKAAEQLGEGAQNALLKTLEEPPTQASLILVATGTGRLLPTIRSRVYTVSLTFVSEATLRAAYPRSILPSDIPELYYSLGRPALLERAREVGAGSSVEQTILGKLFRIASLSLAARCALAEELSVDVERARRYLALWLTGLLQHARREQQVHKTRAYYALIEQIVFADQHLQKTGINARLQLERLFLRVS